MAEKKAKRRKTLLSICASGNEAELKDYIRHHRDPANYELYDNHHWGPLHHAVSSYNVGCVRLLLKTKKIHTRHRSHEGCTALMVAIDKSPPSLEIIRLLITNDAYLIDIPNNEDVYPIHLAIRQRKPTVVQCLCELSKQLGVGLVDRTDWDSETSLMLAARNNDPGIISYLLENTDFNCRRVAANGLNAFELAVLGGNDRNTIKCMETLIIPIYNLNDTQLPNPLMLAIALSISTKHYLAAEWFVNKFYLTEHNANKALIQQLLDAQCRYNEPYQFYNFIFVLHSNIVELPVPHVSMHFYNPIYSNFYRLFTADRNLFDATMTIFLSKIENRQTQIADKAFGIFLIDKFNRDINVSQWLNFLDHFELHTLVDVESVFLAIGAGKTLLWQLVTKKSMKIFLSIILPFYIGPSRRHLLSKFNSHWNRICQDPCRRKIELLDICRTRIRQLLYPKRSSLTNREEINRLMSLDIPIKMKNYLRYNDSDYVFQ